MSKESLHDIRLRQQQLQSASRVYRGMLGLEASDVGKQAVAVAETVSTGLVLGRLLARIFRRRRG